MLARSRNWLLGLTALLALHDARWRATWAELRAFQRRLPVALDRPLPEAMAALTPGQPDLPLSPVRLRRLVDASALFERCSPLGLCLRRSLARYHFLRRAGVPLVIHFGARLNAAAGPPAGRDVAGHAWVTLDGQAYYEDGENYQGFAVMLTYPHD
jgi:hypothetical protein